MSDLDVLVVGGLGVDHIVRVDALPLPVVDSILVPPILSVAGHTGTGVALGCLALGLRTAVADVLGDDLEGRLVRERCAAAGLELHVDQSAGGTRRAVNLVTPDGRRLSLYDPREQDGETPSASLLQSQIGRARHVHVTIMRWAAAALADAVAAGRTTSTDLHDWDGTNPHHRPFALTADLVFLSAAALGPRAHGVAAMILADGRAEVVVVTDGERGSTLHRRGPGPLAVPAVTIPDRPAIDSKRRRRRLRRGLPARLARRRGPPEGRVRGGSRRRVGVRVGRHAYRAHRRPTAGPASRLTVVGPPPVAAVLE